MSRVIPSGPARNTWLKKPAVRIRERRIIYDVPWPDVEMISTRWDGSSVIVKDCRIHYWEGFTLAYVLTKEGYAAGIVRTRISQEIHEIEAIKPVFGLAPMEYLTLIMPGAINNIQFLIRGELDDGRLVSPLTLSKLDLVVSSKHLRMMIERIFVFSFIFSCGFQPHRILVIGGLPIVISCVPLKPDRAKQVTSGSYRNWLDNQPMSALIAKYYGGTDPLKIGARIKYRVDRLIEAMEEAGINEMRIQSYVLALQDALSIGVIVDGANGMSKEVEDKLREPVLITR